MEDEAGYLAMLERQMDEAMHRLVETCRDDLGPVQRDAARHIADSARRTYEEEWAKVAGTVRRRRARKRGGAG